MIAKTGQVTYAQVIPGLRNFKLNALWHVRCATHSHIAKMTLRILTLPLAMIAPVGKVLYVMGTISAKL
jgi:hypothetical protein